MAPPTITQAAALAQRLLKLLGTVGEDLGTIIARHRNQPAGWPLTVRELEVLRLAAEGMGAREICDQLNLTHSTVKTHFANIYRKLGVSDRAAAVAYAIRTGLIEYACRRRRPVGELEHPDLGVVADQEPVRAGLALIAADLDVAAEQR